DRPTRRPDRPGPARPRQGRLRSILAGTGVDAVAAVRALHDDLAVEGDAAAHLPADAGGMHLQQVDIGVDLALLTERHRHVVEIHTLGRAVIDVEAGGLARAGHLEDRADLVA